MQARGAFVFITGVALLSPGCEPMAPLGERVILEGSTESSVVLRARAPFVEREVLLELTPDVAGADKAVRLEVFVEIAGVQGTTDGQEQDRLEGTLSGPEGARAAAPLLPSGEVTLVVEEALGPCEALPCRASFPLTFELSSPTPRTYALDWRAEGVVETRSADPTAAGIAVTSVAR